MAALREFLLKDPGCVHLKDAKGQSALHHAAEHGHSKMAETLLKQGARVDETTKNGATLKGKSMWGLGLGAKAIFGP